MNNNLGFSSDYAVKMSDHLNNLLSNVQVSYMNVRGFHWNIVGKQFFQLHSKYEELYDQLAEMADEVAERILMLGGKPVHAFSKYLKTASIKEKEDVSSTEATLNEVIAETKVLLQAEREILKLAADNNDDGTVDLMTGYISGQEKMLWMLSAFMK